MSNINWELCCLYQSEKDEHLQSSKDEGILSLDRDLNDFKEINATLACIAVSHLNGRSDRHRSNTVVK